MLVFLVFSILSVVLYVLVIIFIMREWRRMEIWVIPPNFQGSTTVSIIVPARNEADSIARLLNSIGQQNYPTSLVQVIIVDDHSEDETVDIVQGFSSVQLLHLSDFINSNTTQSFKKAAIEAAMTQATGSLIIQTDADCWMGSNWLPSLVSMYEKTSCQMIAAPVNFGEENSRLEQFQSLDFIGMMAVTAAGLHSNRMKMCNGANLAYSKEAFQAVNGLQGKTHLASGDDMFLMHKIAEKFPKGIRFLKSTEATVFTHAKPTLLSFYHQRLRWATKNASYDDYMVTIVNVIVFGVCIMFFASLCVIPFSFQYGITSFVIILLGKGIADFLFLRQTSSFFRRKDLMKTFFTSQILHTTYIFIIGIAANIFSTYQWKGRRVK